jgi:hypothetical protein
VKATGTILNYVPIVPTLIRVSFRMFHSDPFLAFALKEGPSMLKALCQSSTFDEENALVGKNGKRYLRVEWLFGQPRMRPFDLYRRQVLEEAARMKDFEVAANGQGHPEAVRLRQDDEVRNHVSLHVKIANLCFIQQLSSLIRSLLTVLSVATFVGVLRGDPARAGATERNDQVPDEHPPRRRQQQAGGLREHRRA